LVILLILMSSKSLPLCCWDFGEPDCKTAVNGCLQNFTDGNNVFARLPRLAMTIIFPVYANDLLDKVELISQLHDRLQSDLTAQDDLCLCVHQLVPDFPHRQVGHASSEYDIQAGACEQITSEKLDIDSKSS
jgi:hypothetical protein